MESCNMSAVNQHKKRDKRDCPTPCLEDQDDSPRDIIITFSENAVKGCAKEHEQAQSKGPPAGNLAPGASSSTDSGSDNEEIRAATLLEAIKEFIYGEEGEASSICKVTLLTEGTSAGRRIGSNTMIKTAVTEICRYMTLDAKNERVQEQGCLGLSKISYVTDTARQVIFEAEGVQSIICAMNNHRGCPEVQSQAIAALNSLAENEFARKKIVALRGIECVAWAMKGCDENLAILTNGCSALEKLACGCEETKKRVGKVGGIDSVIAAMDKHTDDRDLQEGGCRALKSLTSETRVNQWLAGRSYGLEAIVRALNSFESCEGIQYSGCVAVANICWDEEENLLRAAEVGVVQASMKALKEFICDPDFMEHGLCLLRNLSRTNEDTQIDIGEEGGVQLTLECLKVHRSNMMILEHGCAALRYLLFATENRGRILEWGGLEVLVSTIRDGYESLQVSEKAILAVGNAVFDRHDSKRVVAIHGGIVAITKTMSKHLESANIQEYGCRALRNLADSDELNNMLLFAAGAIDAGIFAMISFPNHVEIQEQGCALLFNMSWFGENLQRMRGLDAIRVVEETRERHSKNDVLQKQAEALLEQLNRPIESATSQYRQYPSVRPENSGLMTRQSTRAASRKQSARPASETSSGQQLIRRMTSSLARKRTVR